jgi:membrane protease YdiL (CAAX protease family)
MISQMNVQPFIAIGFARIAEIVCMVILIGRSYDLEAIGLHKNKLITGLKKGFAWSTGFGIFALLFLGVLYLLDYNLLHFFRVPVQGPAYGIFLLLLVGGLISPVAEEIFFRGIIYGYLRRWGILLAVLGSAAFFSMVHLMISGITPVQIIGGLIFAIAYEMEKNLLVPITIHVLGNMAIFTLSILLVQ